MAIDELLRILTPAVIVGVTAYCYNRATRNLYKQIGELLSRLQMAEQQDKEIQNTLKEKDLRVAEQDATIQEQQLYLLEQKQNVRSLRSIMNRNEGRISVYESNEQDYQKEITDLRNQMMAELAKQRFLEKENNELRHEIIDLRKRTNGIVEHVSSL